MLRHVRRIWVSTGLDNVTEWCETNGSLVEKDGAIQSSKEDGSGGEGERDGAKEEGDEC
jgi:hypothetical protein